MFRHQIEFKETISEATFQELLSICIDAHQNRSGSVPIKHIDGKKLLFEGEWKDYPCMTLAYLNLNRIPLFKENVAQWRWEDEDPQESCDLMVELSRPIVV